MPPAYGISPSGYRLPDATRVGRVRLRVSDLQRSLDYYQHVVGLDVIRRDAASAALGPVHTHTILVELQERHGARPVPPHGRFGLYHFALLVPARADLGRFAAHLADVDARVASADHLVSEALYLWDPDGLGIEVYADRPRSQWMVREGELAMSTEPLALRDLVRAAGGLPWKGLPPGTVMGHVHLHVGSLQGAEALYHAAVGFDKVVWSFPGALFLSAGGYHHHLAVNTWVEGASIPGDDDARLMEWELVLPDVNDVAAAAENVTRVGHGITRDREDRIVTDEWGTRLRLTAER